jgi:hypothetical protein
MAIQLCFEIQTDEEEIERCLGFVGCGSFSLSCIVVL